MKFGGTSVADAERLKRAARRIVAKREAGHRVVAVLSARGKETDRLIADAFEVSPVPDPREMDMLLSTGERVSCALCAMAINDLGHRAISLTGSQAGIVTDTSHTKARILGILLDNALRYAAGGGAVTTTVEANGHHAVLRVADRGAGLAPGERSRVFGRFERGAAGERTSGFGLGLAIGRELAQRMGGDLEAEPAERGATFALTLPR